MNGRQTRKTGQSLFPYGLNFTGKAIIEYNKVLNDKNYSCKT
jgi:hypothetical protein